MVEKVLPPISAVGFALALASGQPIAWEPHGDIPDLPADETAAPEDGSGAPA